MTNQDFFIQFTAYAVLLNFGALIFLGQDGIIWDVRAKYFINMLLDMALVCAIYINRHYLQIKYSIFIALIVLLVQFYAVYCSDTINEHSVYAKSDAVIQFLNENNLKFGYATFWNADIIYYLSNGNIVLTTVKSADEYTEIGYWLASETIIDCIEASEQKFLLVTAKEYEESVILKTHSVIYKDDNYYVLDI